MQTWAPCILESPGDRVLVDLHHSTAKNGHPSGSVSICDDCTENAEAPAAARPLAENVALLSFQDDESIRGQVRQHNRGLGVSCCREKAEAAAAARPKVKKNVALLSFEDDDDGGDGDEGGVGTAVEASRIRSAHEAIDDAR